MSPDQLPFYGVYYDKNGQPRSLLTGEVVDSTKVDRVPFMGRFLDENRVIHDLSEISGGGGGGDDILPKDNVFTGANTFEKNVVGPEQDLGDPDLNEQWFTTVALMQQGLSEKPDLTQFDGGAAGDILTRVDASGWSWKTPEFATNEWVNQTISTALENKDPIVATVASASTILFNFSEDGQTFNFLGGTFGWFATHEHFGVITISAQVAIPFVTGRLLILDITDENNPTLTTKSINPSMTFSANEFVVGNMYRERNSAGGFDNVVYVFGGGIYTTAKPERIEYGLGGEIDTGKNWIDGRPIYTNVWHINEPFSVAGTSSAHSWAIADIAEIITIDAWCHGADTDRWPLPYINAEDPTVSLGMSWDFESILLSRGANFIDEPTDAYAIITYIKATD